jgi:hypothetical protein
MRSRRIDLTSDRQKKKRRGVTAALKVFDQILITWIPTS